MVQINKNLIIQNIEPIKAGNNITIEWILFFTFYNIEGFSAIITKEDIDKPYASFSRMESDEGNLHESFCDAIENKWDAIVHAVKNW